MRNIATAAALRNEEGGLGEGLREKEGKEERGRKGETTRRRSDGVINDRVFNTLYGLAYKLRAVHRSSWQRINGRGAEHAGGSLRSLAFSFSISRSLSLLPSFVLILPLRAACNRSLLPASRAVHAAERVIVSWLFFPPTAARFRLLLLYRVYRVARMQMNPLIRR